MSSAQTKGGKKPAARKAANPKEPASISKADAKQKLESASKAEQQPANPEGVTQAPATDPADPVATQDDLPEVVELPSFISNFCNPDNDRFIKVMGEIEPFARAEEGLTDEQFTAVSDKLEDDGLVMGELLAMLVWSQFSQITSGRQMRLLTLSNHNLQAELDEEKKLGADWKHKHEEIAIERDQLLKRLSQYEGQSTAAKGQAATDTDHLPVTDRTSCETALMVAKELQRAIRGDKAPGIPNLSDDAVTAAKAQRDAILDEVKDWIENRQGGLLFPSGPNNVGGALLEIDIEKKGETIGTWVYTLKKVTLDPPAAAVSEKAPAA